MKLHEMVIIHLIEVIAGQNQHEFGFGRENFAQLLADGVRRALIPRMAGHGLLRGQNIHPAIREHVAPVSALNVAMQRDGIELRENGDFFDAGVQAIAERNVNQPVFSGQRHGRFRAHFRERIEARSLSAA